MVFWLDPTPTSCAWKLYDPALGQIRKLTETPTCPRRILWDRPGRRAFFEREGRIWELDWDHLGEPRDRASVEPPMTIPEGVDAGPFMETTWWISRSTGRLRIGRSLPLVGDNEFGDEAPRSVEYEGKTYPMARLPFVVRHPTFGAQVTAIALVWELSPQQDWKRISTRGTRIVFPTMDYCDEGECGHHDVIRERVRFADGLFAVGANYDPRSEVVNPGQAAAAADCDVSGRCKPKDLNLGDDIRVLLTTTTASDHDVVDERVVLCRVPLKLRDRACAEADCVSSLELAPSSIKWSPSLQRYRRYGLLVDSRTASRPLLVSADKLAALWSAPNGKLAAWLPWPELWKQAP